MKIKEFIDNYNKMQHKSVASVSKMIEAKTYIPVLRKRYLAELVYNASIDIENGIVVVDSLSKYLTFTMLMITEYTNLEFSVDEKGAATEEAINEYDLLCSENMIDPIIACFAADYARSNEILNYVFQDKLAAHNTVEAVLGNAANHVLALMDGLTAVIAEKVDNFNYEMPDLNTESVLKLLEMLKPEEE